MDKLSHSKYYLPEVTALTGFGLMSTGTTEPMKVRGVDKRSSIRNQYVVKFRNSSRMTTSSSFKELLGAWMAKEIDLNCVEPVLVDIGIDFVDTLKRQEGYKNALQSLGINFGSIFLDGYILTPNTSESFYKNLLDQVRLIFMFDMFISNADRGAGKPNVLNNGNELLILDHELAFSFTGLLPFLRNTTPWIFSELELEVYKKHYFYPILQQEENDFTQFIDLLDRFDNNFWNQVNKWTPSDWKGPQLLEIRAYLDSIIEHKSIFAEQLSKILAA